MLIHPRATAQRRRIWCGRWRGLTSATNSSLASAKLSKEDEFYTQLPDIENELRHYRKYFKGKVVYCNCDDPRVSNFFHYFSHNFEKLGLKKLIATCYKNQDLDLFSQNDAERAIYLEYEGDKDGDRLPGRDEIDVNQLQGDGDFRSAEAIELLKQSDIVVTNPPFSLFRPYIEQLMTHDKKFLIVGNQNTISYKEIFRLIQSNKIWLGYNSGDMAFRVPNYYPPRDHRFWIDENGNKWRSLGNACWFTNLDISKRHEDLILYKSYSPDEYPSYVNYDAIDVSRYKDIPVDYDGVMGVPVTLLDQFNPDQFELVGNSDDAEQMKQIGVRPLGEDFIRAYRDAGGTGHRTQGMRMLGLMEPQPRVVFKRILIRRK